MKIFIKVAKYIAIVIVICLAVFLLWAFWFVANFHGDTYRDSESYVIIENSVNKTRMSVEGIVNFLYQFQYSHPEYRLITSNEKGEKYHKFSREIPYRSNLYGVFFYFKDMDMTVSCIVEISKKNNPLIRLYAVSEGVHFASWKRINNYKEISHKENRAMKKKFETEILDNLGVGWKHKKFWD